MALTLGAFQVRTQESGVIFPTSRGPSGLSGESVIEIRYKSVSKSKMKKVFKIYDNQNLINTKHYIERDYLPTTLTLMVAVSLPFSLDKTTLYLPESDFSAALLNSLISVGVFSKLKQPPCDRGLPPYWKNVVMLIHVIASVSLFSCYLFKGTFSLEINV